MTTPADDRDRTGQAPAEAERLARRLVEDVAAFEVDPPAPARVTDGDTNEDRPVE